MAQDMAEENGAVVIAAIPAYNAARTIGEVVRRVMPYVHECLVVNDGSTDSTGAVACVAGAEVIAHSRNMGKGAAVRTALVHARGMACDYVVLLDADGQHDPDEIPGFVARARERQVDMVCGTRMANPRGMPWLRRATNRTMSWFVSWLCQVRLTDTQCGYRLLSARAARMIELHKDNFEVESEMLIQAVALGLSIDEVPIRTIYGEDHSSHIRPIRDTLRFMKLVWQLSLRRFLLRHSRSVSAVRRPV